MGQQQAAGSTGHGTVNNKGGETQTAGSKGIPLRDDEEAKQSESEGDHKHPNLLSYPGIC